MMYLALSYDHRIIDGQEAVLFLVDIKNPWRIRAHAARASEVARLRDSANSV